MAGVELGIFETFAGNSTCFKQLLLARQFRICELQLRLQPVAFGMSTGLGGSTGPTEVYEVTAAGELGLPAVVGVPDEQRGQIVKAFVVLRPGHDASEAMVKTLQDHVKQSIAPYKYPRPIEFSDALPRKETGKLQRFRLRT